MRAKLFEFKRIICKLLILRLVLEESSGFIEDGIVVINQTTRHWKIIRFIFANVDCFIYTRTAAPRTSRPCGGLSIGAWSRKGTIIDPHSGLADRHSGRRRSRAVFF